MFYARDEELSTPHIQSAGLLDTLLSTAQYSTLAIKGTLVCHLGLVNTILLAPDISKQQSAEFHFPPHIV